MIEISETILQKESKERKKWINIWVCTTRNKQVGG
jgi:hypothetical protein